MIPEEFVKRASEEYREWPGMLAMLKIAFAAEDSITIGKVLDGGTYPNANQLTPEEILKALDRGDINALRASAEKSLRRKRLSREWHEMEMVGKNRDIKNIGKEAGA